jgi:hypothetical protein
VGLAAPSGRIFGVQIVINQGRQITSLGGRGFTASSYTNAVMEALDLAALQNIGHFIAARGNTTL